MPLLFMDAGYEPNSPDSLSAEESCRNTSGLDRDGEVQRKGPRVTKKREKNRDAARKSRRKQTERADELHEELQSLEQSNSALHKEIAALRKDLHFYETSLERHKPYCRLRDSSSSSAGPEVSSSPPRASKCSSSPLPASLNPAAGFQTFSCAKQTHLTSSASAPPRPTPAVSSSSSSSSPLTVPYSVSFSTQPAPHSLFCKPPRIPFAGATPVCPGLVSNPVPSSSSSATRLQSGTIHRNSPGSESSCFAGDQFLMKLDAPLAASSKTHSGAENATAAIKRGGSMDVPQLYPCQFRGNLNGARSPLQPPPPQYPGPQTLSVSTQAGLVPSHPAPPYQQHVSSSPESLLSLLTVPSPLVVPQTTSSAFNGVASQPTQSLPPLPDPSKDYSLSELLEINDWILSGVSYQ
ncbi:flocculation protein FLO11 [Kryptolebias marmoratus]|uniref:flocculation protein FLO11 n=1 Tax=Kryptolebias marmoratus TaxID=37003 RepID=UPI0007F88F63|nr:flocculation protein FLO11 [Kryptolebias marmoratus]